MRVECHLANLLSFKGVKDSFIRKLTTIASSRSEMSRKKMQQVTVIYLESNEVTPL